ncbi:MAG: nuclear transport factor 2 family protein [Pseudomonadota bacterium]
MTTKEVAEALVAHCRNGTEAEGLATLYSPQAVSEEAPGSPGAENGPAEGVEAIKGKHQWWDENFEVHGAEVDGPYVHGDMFAVNFGIDATEKASGQRWQMKEVGLYHVADGKIVREQFFMAPMG